MDERRFQRVAKALSDPRRFEIFQSIASCEGGELSCGSVGEKTCVAQATVSHHLKELTDADLVSPRSEGQFRFFKANKETMNEYIAELQNRLQI